MKRVAIVLALLATSAVAHAEPNAWQRTFVTKRAPKTVFFRATFEDASGKPHEVRSWRDGDKRLRRDTDAAMSLLVTRAAGGELAYELVDRVQKVKVEVNRTNLYRVGLFSDWSALATNVAEPRTKYDLVVTDRTEKRKVGGDCRWVKLDKQEICWSDAWGVPLVIRRDAREIYRVVEISSKVDAKVFEPEQGLFVVDANEDMGGD